MTGGAPPVEVGDPQRTEAGGATPRRPSWLRALLLSLLVLAAGAALGVVWFRLAQTTAVRPPDVERVDDGWRVTASHGREFTGLALNGTRLLWRNRTAIEYLDLETGKLRLLGPATGMHATWEPALGDRYAVWFEAERPASLAARAVAYDTRTGRRWTLAEVGSVRSFPAISGDVAVWCSAAAIGSPAINAARIGSGEVVEVAAGDGAPVISGGLVAWATSWTGPFRAAELTGSASWPVTAGGGGRLTAISLAGRLLVYGQAAGKAGSGVVVASDLDGGGTTTLASGISGLSGPACDGRTVVWGEKTAEGGRVMGRRLRGGPSFLVAETTATVKEVAVSGDTVAWITTADGAQDGIVVARLPR